MQGHDNRAGDALAAALGLAEGQPGTDAGRSLLLAVLRLHELGALTFEMDPAAVHGSRPVGEPGAVVGGDPAKAGLTTHAYNMGSLFASESDSR